jgi:hypothetical protein
LEAGTFGDTYGAHESFLNDIQQIDGDGTMAVCGLLIRLRADDERCGRHELALEILAGAPARADGVPVLANESFGANFVHPGYEVSFRFWRHGSFRYAQ